MTDAAIVELYHARNERAITETNGKYGRYCHYIAFHILNNNADADECVNDTWLRAWNVMPPKRPTMLQTFLGKITRNLSIDRSRKNDALKRGGGETTLAIDELTNCIPDGDFAEKLTEQMVLSEILNRFLGTLNERTRKVFVQRYWYLMEISEIAKVQGMSVSNVKVTLSRTREKLRTVLEEEGVAP